MNLLHDIKGLFPLCLLLGALLSGCAEVRYDTLGPIPEYPRNDFKYNTKGPVELQPGADARADAAVMTLLAKCGCKDVSRGRHYRGSVSRPRILTVLDLNIKTLNLPEGKYLETRVIISVRAPGEVRGGRLKCEEPSRFFQAFSRKFIGKREPLPEEFSEGIRAAVENLFTIDEFRKALEPPSHAVIRS